PRVRGREGDTRGDGGARPFVRRVRKELFAELGEKMKRVAMIPALLGSQRIPDKNLVLVDGYPMMFRVVEACKNSGAFDEIYINSEHGIFRDWAQMMGVKFYQRPATRGGSACTMKNKSRQCSGDRCQTHDHFLYDFMTHLKEPSYLALIHTTSPLLSAE